MVKKWEKQILKIKLEIKIYLWKILFLPLQKRSSSFFEIPKIQIHRGLCQKELIENTRESLRRSFELGYVMAEIDVQLTRDLIPVLWHDEDLKRLAQKDLKISELDLAQVREYFDVASLEEVLKMNDRPPLLNIELKSKSIFDNQLEERVADVIERVFDLKYDSLKAENLKKINRPISDKGSLPQACSAFLFSSFNPFSLRRIQKKLPQFPRALLVTFRKEPGNNFFLRNLLSLWIVSVDAIHFDLESTDAEIIKLFKKKGYFISMWTLKSLRLAPHLMSHFKIEEASFLNTSPNQIKGIDDFVDSWIVEESE